MSNKKSVPADEHKKRLKRLEAMSESEWEEAINNFWRWYEKVSKWGETPISGKPGTPEE
ncbi:hypothetical protein ACFLSW_03705 [Candidatus Bipolaricaulota bacterium]